jgi:syndecan 4
MAKQGRAQRCWHVGILFLSLILVVDSQCPAGYIMNLPCVDDPDWQGAGEGGCEVYGPGEAYHDTCNDNGYLTTDEPYGPNPCVPYGSPNYKQCNGCLKCCYSCASACIIAGAYSTASHPGHACTKCANGKYTNSGGTYPHTNAIGTVCTDCPPGSTSLSMNPQGVLVDPLTTGGGEGYYGPTFCICPAPQYWDSSAGTCNLCPAGSTSPSGSTGVTQCTCNSGYSGPPGGPCTPVDCGVGKTGPAGSCTNCVPGTYKAVSGSAACTLCPAGKYSTATGGSTSSTCQSCIQGKYSAATGASTAGTCQTCPGMTTTSSDRTSVTACMCIFGYEMVGTDPLVCQACQAGKYKSDSGNVACENCLAGKYSATTWSCSACPAYSTSPAGSSAVTACTCNVGYGGPAGGPCTVAVSCNTAYYRNTINVCVACQSGKYNDLLGQTTCKNCSAGTYSSATAQSTATTCQNCLAGTYSNLPGSSVCTLCTAFSTSPTASSACTCNSGYEKVGTDPFVCQSAPCAAGSTGPSGNCTQCLVGKYKNVSGSAPCDLCSAGTYSATEGNTACTLCPSAFRHSPVGSSTQAACTCPPNSVLNAEGTRCLCNVGYEGLGEFAEHQCFQCKAGTYKSAVGMPRPWWHSRFFPDDNWATYTCLNRPEPLLAYKPSLITGNGWESCAQYYSYHDYCRTKSDQTDLYTGCAYCCNACMKLADIPSSSLNPSCAGSGSNPQSICYPCPGNSHSVPGSANCTCNLGYQRLPDTWTGVVDVERSCSALPECALGYYGPSWNCTACPKGTFKSRIGSSEQGTEAQVNHQCALCSNNGGPGLTTFRIASTSYGDCKCIAGWIGIDLYSCTQCPAGKFQPIDGFLSSGTCTTCQAGTYSLAGATVCQNCTTHSTQVHTTSPIGSTSFSSCTCKSGYEKVGTNPFECIALACAAGSTGPAGSCAQCVPGKYKTVSGSSPCDDCLAGKYSAVTGSSTSSTCQNCSVGTYSATPGSSACSVCPSYSTSAAGSSAVTQCTCNPGWQFFSVFKPFFCFFYIYI